MELRFTILRIAILFVCLAVFYFLGGFVSPVAAMESGQVTYQQMRAWVLTVAMFVVGAACVSIVEHEVGTMDPMSLKPLYVIVGIALMVTGYFWGDAVRRAVVEQNGVYLDWSTSSWLLM